MRGLEFHDDPTEYIGAGDGAPLPRVGAVARVVAEQIVGATLGGRIGYSFDIERGAAPRGVKHDHVARAQASEVPEETLYQDALAILVGRIHRTAGNDEYFRIGKERCRRERKRDCREVERAMREERAHT